MQTIFTKPIFILLQPSILLLGLLLALATSSSLIIFSLLINLTIKCCVVGWIGLLSVYFIARDALLVLPWSWHEIQVVNAGVLTLINRRNQ